MQNPPRKPSRLKKKQKGQIGTLEEKRTCRPRVGWETLWGKVSPTIHKGGRRGWSRCNGVGDSNLQKKGRNGGAQNLRTQLFRLKERSNKGEGNESRDKPILKKILSIGEGQEVQSTSVLDAEGQRDKGARGS